MKTAIGSFVSLNALFMLANSDWDAVLLPSTVNPDGTSGAQILSLENTAPSKFAPQKFNIRQARGAGAAGMKSVKCGDAVVITGGYERNDTTVTVLSTVQVCTF